MIKVNYIYHGKGNAEVTVLKETSLSFEKGKMYALYGPSGSGKTTTLMLLGGLEEPDAGEILLDGKNIKDIGYQLLRRSLISYVFQDFLLFPYMTAIENVMVAENISRKWKAKDRRKKAESMLKKMGLTDAEMHRIVTKLSGGQQQRVAIARALVGDAEYILADEPTGNLDRENTISICGELSAIAHREGKCVIIVTHSEYIREQCDIVYYIDRK